LARGRLSRKIASAAAAAILEALVERKTIGSKVMIVVAHPDDETIGMDAQPVPVSRCVAGTGH
jgi:hypothetical protein